MTDAMDALDAMAAASAAAAADGLGTAGTAAGVSAPAPAAAPAAIAEARPRGTHPVVLLEDVSRVFANVGKAVAAYEKSLRHAPTRLDGYIEGASVGGLDHYLYLYGILVGCA